MTGATVASATLGAAAAVSTRVGLVQINNSFSNQNYLPLSVGMLQAYAQKYLPEPTLYEFLLPIYARGPVGAAVERLEDTDIVFFSTYVWNFRISLEIARRLKARRPATVIVFGGPHVPDRVESFLREHRFIDVACHGEGEAAATALLEAHRAGDWQAVPSISYLDREGALVRTPRAPRIKDLGGVPSPFLEGVFAPLVAANPQERWIAMWETNRGCPFSCTFCDWGSATQAKVSAFDLERLYREVDWFADQQIEFVFCCDANFGILPRDADIATYVADVKARRGYPHALSVQNTKNATARAYRVQKILADAGLNKGVAVALQSIDQTTLASIKRSNISTESYQELQRRFTRDDVETFTDLILGLPGETYDSFADGVSRVIANGQHNRIQFNNLSILPNAEMGDPEYQRKFGMKTVESRIINVHGALNEAEDDGIFETQVLVIATDTMAEADWVRTRSFAWMAGFLHFDKVMQIPLVLVRELAGVPYRDLIETFADGAPEDSSVLAQVQAFFRARARDIQAGGPEYCRSEEWLNIWWPADEYILIRLCVEGRLGAFYAEAERRLTRLLAERGRSLPDGVLHEAVLLNRSLVKLPFVRTDLELELGHNIWEFYRGVLRGVPAPLAAVPSRYRIDRTSRTWSSWDDWCREVVWYGNKKGAYLYGNDPVGPQLAGHF
jgi:tRNA A37 methylthiotransferase MiaB